jgi:death on curing protein
MKKLIYPSEDKVIENNFLILQIIKVKKADQSKVLSHSKIREIIEECENNKGDIYDKAVILLRGLIKKHPFSSGNRRTAFVTTKEFVLNNNHSFKIKDDPSYARTMLGIREDFYSDDELKYWIKNGKIREFER